MSIKVLQIGLGSMGKRRIRNLQYLGFKNIVGYDIRTDRQEEANKLYEIKTVESLEQISWDDFTHLIISTPPDCHHEYIIEGISKGKHVFVEASVLDDGFDEIIALDKQSNKILAPSCTMRFHPLIAKIKSVIDKKELGDVLFFQHYFGEYLPYWHPYEDINDFYVSNPKTAATREIVPFDYNFLSWIFGEIDICASIISKSGKLSADINDVYSIIGKTDNNIPFSFTVDVLSKKFTRQTKVICSKGNIDFDYEAQTLQLYFDETKTERVYTLKDLATTTSNEEMYVKEMEAFINCSINNTRFPYTILEDYKLLQSLYKAEANNIF